MRVLILGAAGMIGRKLSEQILSDGKLAGQPLSGVTLFDVVPGQAPADATVPVEISTGDLSDPNLAPRLLENRPDVIFHLAAIVSGQAEAEFETGYRINMDGTRYLLEAIRNCGGGYCPKLVYASSIATYGAPFPEVIDDHFHLTPLTSYGTQKAIGELLLADYSRRGFCQGIGIRLPTICVRPGVPNKAASGFFSSIIREPLQGIEAVLPVPDDVRHWFASPRSAVGFLTHAVQVDRERLGTRVNLAMPGLSVTIGEIIETVERIAGPKATALIRREPDPAIMAMVEGWPRTFTAERAVSLGFQSEKSFDEIVKVFIDDELGGAPRV